jgi:hypothetical protein
VIYHHQRRLDRALFHLEDLKAEVNTWLKERPHRTWTVTETEDDVPKKYFYCQVLRRPPSHLSLIVGDCLHNLRSALDNLVYELAVVHHGGQLPSDIEEILMFPIFDTRKGFREKGKYRIRGLDPSAQKVIEELQPYNQERNNWATRNPLWKLNALSKRDKHRLPPVASLVNLTALSYIVPDGIETEDVQQMVTAFENRAAIARYPALDKTGAEVEDIDFNPIFSVGFSHLVPKELLGRQIPEVLEDYPSAYSS